MTAHVLMLSSSRQGDEAYLEHARSLILAHLGSIRDLLFIPYAAVTQSYDNYVSAVASALPECNVTGLHTFGNPIQAINNAKANNQAIVVGGGNTFHLMHTIYQQNLLVSLQHAISEGTPYIGWSAGSNICGQSIRTTNDMPIVEPKSFNALNVVPFQLNPHYSDYHPPGHNGETRDQRLAEFTVLNPSTPVVAIREGTALSLSQQKLTLVGEKGGFIFLGDEKRPIAPNDDLTELLNSSL
ncbi:peptidase E [Alteromonas stellipolaris]|jgi:dipeptidase E|uniref:Dipeptidase PepE n=1 Tax=Alteromonas stellipolaris TaxID=233316 RepID=A0AAW7Z7X0_9ALTE|nr:dipeptidase PepE [Alteromonas stellipolaris]AMJ94315.1 peptidase E [Alteromonas stellipolaris]ANB26672.1 peptidase E [Alteromonas stellipolaris]MDO6579508.1 dipeptidase PepE [Alteromonas stellipolaris]